MTLIDHIKDLFPPSERNPMACEEIADEFNDLRSDIVLLFDLKNALNSAEYELQTSLHRLKSENGPLSSTQPLSASSNSSNDTPRAVITPISFAKRAKKP